MNNAVTAKLSKLVYTAPDNPDFLFKIGEFDRLVLLVRRLYQILDEQNALFPADALHPLSKPKGAYCPRRYTG